MFCCWLDRREVNIFSCRSNFMSPRSPFPTKPFTYRYPAGSGGQFFRPANPKSIIDLKFSDHLTSAAIIVVLIVYPGGLAVSVMEDGAYSGIMRS